MHTGATARLISTVTASLCKGLDCTVQILCKADGAYVAKRSVIVDLVIVFVQFSVWCGQSLKIPRIRHLKEKIFCAPRNTIQAQNVQSYNFIVQNVDLYIFYSIKWSTLVPDFFCWRHFLSLRLQGWSKVHLFFIWTSTITYSVQLFWYWDSPTSMSNVFLRAGSYKKKCAFLPATWTWLLTSVGLKDG